MMRVDAGRFLLVHPCASLCLPCLRPMLHHLPSSPSSSSPSSSSTRTTRTPAPSPVQSRPNTPIVDAHSLSTVRPHGDATVRHSCQTSTFAAAASSFFALGGPAVEYRQRAGTGPRCQPFTVRTPRRGTWPAFHTSPSSVSVGALVLAHLVRRNTLCLMPSKTWHGPTDLDSLLGTNNAERGQPQVSQPSSVSSRPSQPEIT